MIARLRIGMAALAFFHALALQTALWAQTAAPVAAGPARAPAASVALDAGTIGKLPHQIVTVRQRTPQGERMVEWRGSLLWDVLVAQHLIDPDKHAEQVRTTILVTGRDGYTARLVAAEVSPDFAAKRVILADRQDGVDLPDHALRLIVPDEKRAGRSVRDPISIAIER